MKDELKIITGIRELTPIEIALEIDEEGRTTARKLYSWLELNPSNYSKWVKRNILENSFAENKVDFYSYQSTSEEGRGNFAEDYKITSEFAKKLAMTTKSNKGEEARDYFIKVESKLKEVVKTMQLVLSDKDKAILDIVKAKSDIERANAIAFYDRVVTQPLLEQVDRYERFLCEKTGVLTKTELATKLDTKTQTLAPKLKKAGVYTPTSQISGDFLKKYPDIKMVVECKNTYMVHGVEHSKPDFQWTHEGSKILVDYLISIGMVTFTDNNGFKLKTA